MVSNNSHMKRGRILSIAIGILLIFLVFMGDARALSDANVSDKILDDYPNIKGSKGIFQGAEKMALQVTASNEVKITRIGHFDGTTKAVEVFGNYGYLGLMSTDMLG